MNEDFSRVFRICRFFCVLVLPAPQGLSIAMRNDNSARQLLRDMVGTWKVEELMWPDSSAKAVPLPAALAHRQMVGDDFVEEVMRTPASEKKPFTRVAYFGFNAVTRQYEYFSLDTRAPQMMNERSNKSSEHMSDSHGVNLPGGTFVAPQWGPAKNAAFRYRIVVGRIEGNRQIVELYLTPVTTGSKHEFLAMKYIYTRAPER